MISKKYLYLRIPPVTFKKREAQLKFQKLLVGEYLKINSESQSNLIRFSEVETSQRTLKRPKLDEIFNQMQAQAPTPCELLIPTLLYFHKPEIFLDKFLNNHLAVTILDSSQVELSNMSLTTQLAEIKKNNRKFFLKLKIKNGRKKPIRNWGFKYTNLARRKNAKERNLEILEIIKNKILPDLEKISYTEIANVFNLYNVPTPSGRKNKYGNYLRWHGATVKYVLRRCNIKISEWKKTSSADSMPTSDA